MPTLEAISDDIRNVKETLQQHEPKIVFGHGDFKPSNAMLSEDGVKFIDFELAGPNYRGFDLMKVFRTAAVPSEPSVKHFLRVYAEHTSSTCSESTVLSLLEETH